MLGRLPNPHSAAECWSLADVWITCFGMSDARAMYTVIVRCVITLRLLRPSNLESRRPGHRRLSKSRLHDDPLIRSLHAVVKFLRKYILNSHLCEDKLLILQDVGARHMVFDHVRLDGDGHEPLVAGRVNFL
jgi:hypothetical protein